ncbi:rolling circle replication-associated protein [Mucilaginibacter gilvus]|uniref:Replication-associated protein ORF2/G2P domain-containing protein n=1 Tax=Mucilaginibacter gilvus TaxID=2305909 RepID=A0A444MQJ3_9SPHI|nr:hypothetical protein [Mucilaginibacter gilvus]RWY53879.1 hypothetical protein EPL05_07385 [Mucilaginibacter gilvus]
MILKNTYGCTLVLDIPERAAGYENKFSGSSLDRPKSNPKPKTKFGFSAEGAASNILINEDRKKGKNKDPDKTFKMSQRTKTKIRKKLIAFSRVYNKLNFLALTFVNQVADEKAIIILRKFLDNTKKRSEDFQYIWVAERQLKNTTFAGNIHFHIVTNKSWDIDKYWNYWLTLQRDNGVVPREEGFKPSSAFDIRRINKENIKAIQLYLTKYISKNTDEFKCQVWNCSKKISQLYTDFYTKAEFLDNAYKLEGDNIYEAYSERCTLHFIPLNQKSIKIYAKLDEKNILNK